MKFLYACAALALTSAAAAADDKKSKQPPPKPCTIHSTSTGGFFDLNSLYVELPKKDAKPVKKEAQTESWHARGYDYGANFTLNFCGPVVEELDRVEDVDKSLWRNVSAYYTMNRKTYSMG
jgi:cation-dependent mannose-6-phosphate receptor